MSSVAAPFSDIDEAVYLSNRVIVLTPSPTSVQQILEIDLPFPRDQVTTKEPPEFARLRAHVWRSIKRPDEARPDAPAAPERTPEPA